MDEETKDQEMGGPAHGDDDSAEAQIAEDAEMMRRLQEEIRNLPVSEHILYMMHSLSTLAVGRMGVAPDTAEMKDLDQARMAIDAFRALMAIVEPARAAEEMTAHRSMLSQLQLAYVNSLEKREAEPSAGEASEAEGEGEPAAESAGESPGQEAS
ncbi:MAG: hypothetical protein GXY46_09245 [Actinobacteria bacterium]|nr:hypothetical protein [Actinomycetota bacterium]